MNDGERDRGEEEVREGDREREGGGGQTDRQTDTDKKEGQIETDRQTNG